MRHTPPAAMPSGKEPQDSPDSNPLFIVVAEPVRQLTDGNFMRFDFHVCLCFQFPDSYACIGCLVSDAPFGILYHSRDGRRRTSILK